MKTMKNAAVGQIRATETNETGIPDFTEASSRRSKSASLLAVPPVFATAKTAKRVLLPVATLTSSATPLLPQRAVHEPTASN
jgi:hypothetical protein